MFMVKVWRKGKNSKMDTQKTLHPYKYSQLQVRLGESNIRKVEGSEQIVYASKIIPHPKYDNDTTDNDIMLIKLNSPATINSRVSTVSLPNSCPTFDTECLVSGWDDTVNVGSKCYLERKSQM